MMRDYDDDRVSKLIRHCHQDPQIADRLFERLIAAQEREVTIEGERIVLSETERGEFVERYSAEVEPTLWESKRRKH